MQQPVPLEMSGAQVKGLVLERGVGPGKPERQESLDGQDDEQRPIASGSRASTAQNRNRSAMIMCIHIGDTCVFNRCGLNQMPGRFINLGIFGRRLAADQDWIPVGLPLR